MLLNPDLLSRMVKSLSVRLYDATVSSGVNGIELATGRSALVDPVCTTDLSLLLTSLLLALLRHFRVCPSVCNKVLIVII